MSKQLQRRPTFKYKSNNLFSSSIHTRFSTRMTKLELYQVIDFIWSRAFDKLYLELGATKKLMITVLQHMCTLNIAIIKYVITFCIMFRRTS